MIKISATEFKAKCLALIDEVGKTGDTIVIEKRGKAIAQLQKYIPVTDGIPQFSLRGTVSVNADVTKPVLPATEWNMIGE